MVPKTDIVRYINLFKPTAALKGSSEANDGSSGIALLTIRIQWRDMTNIQSGTVVVLILQLDSFQNFTSVLLMVLKTNY